MHPCLAALLHWPLQRPSPEGTHKAYEDIPSHSAKETVGESLIPAVVYRNSHSHFKQLFMYVRGSHFDPKPGVMAGMALKEVLRHSRWMSCLISSWELITSPVPHPAERQFQSVPCLDANSFSCFNRAEDLKSLGIAAGELKIHRKSPT